MTNPSVTCRRCGNLKLPKQHCEACGPVYRSEQSRAKHAREKVEAIKQRRQAKEEKRRAATRLYQNDIQRNRPARYGRVILILCWALEKLLGVFEKDLTGNWQLYENRLAELQATIKICHRLLSMLLVVRKQPYEVEEKAKDHWREICEVDAN